MDHQLRRLIFSVIFFSHFHACLNILLNHVSIDGTSLQNLNFGNSYYQNEKLYHGRRPVEWSNTKKINWMCKHSARFSTANFSIGLFFQKGKVKGKKQSETWLNLCSVNRFEHVQMSTLHHLYTKTKWIFILIGWIFIQVAF